MKWSPEVITEMKDLLASGMNSVEVAEELSASTGAIFTASAVRNAALYYRTDDEHEEDEDAS